GLRWSAVTVDGGDDARDALDRITIPPEVLARIAPNALPRSSIVISDEPLSAETNYRTEFVAVLSNQPQGGFITRKPSTDVLADTDPNGDDRFGWFSQRGWGSPTGDPYQRSGSSGPQAAPQRNGAPQTGAQRGWGYQTGGNPDWRGNGYYRREDQR